MFGWIYEGLWIQRADCTVILEGQGFCASMLEEYGPACNASHEKQVHTIHPFVFCFLAKQ